MCTSVLAISPCGQPRFPAGPLRLASAPDSAGYVFQRSQPTEAYLTSLRTTYQLDKLVAGQPTDLARVRAVCAWVQWQWQWQWQWQHSSYQQPQHWDPAAILAEAAQGKSFRCVECGSVLSGALTAPGIPARVLGLQTADVETRKSGAGHVLAEAWLADQHKWVLVDGQWDVVPLLNGVPLNAVELQRALAGQTPGFTVASAAGTTARKYGRWFRPYLFYFGTSLDCRVGVKDAPGSLMLVPLGAKDPTVFQRTSPVRHTRYTHSVASFYPAPQ